MTVFPTMYKKRKASIESKTTKNKLADMNIERNSSSVFGFCKNNYDEFENMCSILNPVLYHHFHFAAYEKKNNNSETLFSYSRKVSSLIHLKFTKRCHVWLIETREQCIQTQCVQQQLWPQHKLRLFSHFYVVFSCVVVESGCCAAWTCVCVGKIPQWINKKKFESNIINLWIVFPFWGMISDLVPRICFELLYLCLLWIDFSLVFQC